MNVPELRIRRLNALPVVADRDFVLYWMVMSRRTRYNFGLQRAVEWCEQLGKPLLVLEALRCGYEWASDRVHRFVLQGMAANRQNLRETSVGYYAYVERQRGEGAGLLEALAAHASVVVTDDFPCFFLPRMLDQVSQRLPVALEAVDSNGLLPMRAAAQVYPTAYAFRRFLHEELPAHLDQFPSANPVARRNLPPLRNMPEGIRVRWPEATDDLLQATPGVLAKLPIDHDVRESVFGGGMFNAEKNLRRFLDRRFERYAEERNYPNEEVTSELSPYLHFGHISVHDVFKRIANRETWTVDKVLSQKATGKRAGWWHMSETAEGFLDEIVTWRELGYNMCWQRDDYDKYESLPEWSQKTLEDHQSDPRDPCYSLREFENASTYDNLWNAAQTQLVREGRLHNYMRMLWGKKILEWSESPREALRIMIHLNNKYAVDGRNPNSYSGIFWCLGRYDRPWGPERPIFGKVRYMSSENTARKFKVDDYLQRYGDQHQPRLF